MRVGLVCPYSFDVPGGVQYHVRDLAEHLLGKGHHASVLAPADEGTPLPDYVTSCGRAVPVRYNGSVARLNFGPVTAARVNRWLDHGDFDVLHVHEPVTPSISLLALWASTGPVVATFHTSNLRSRAMQAAHPLLRPSLEKINARVAVSEEARRTILSHLRSDAIVIPNGVRVDRFETASARPEWVGTPDRPTIAFLGRIDEPRKGLPVLARAVEAVLEDVPGLRVLVAGPGSPETARSRMPAPARGACEFLGAVSDEDKAALLASVDLYVAPHTGGESFGIVLVEAMAAGAPVLASNLPAFEQVLDGESAGATFVARDPADLAAQLRRLLGDSGARARLRAAGHVRARRFDWSVVAEDLLAVYETVTHTSADTDLATEVSRIVSAWGTVGPEGGDE